jgi:hypothetical protein
LPGRCGRGGARHMGERATDETRSRITAPRRRPELFMPTSI